MWFTSCFTFFPYTTLFRSFNLDEYVGLAADHPQSYAAYMQEHLFEHVPFVAEQLFLPPGFCRPSDEQCMAFSARRSEEHTSELQSRGHLVCRLLLEKKKEA